GDTGDDLGGRGQDDFRPAPPHRADDLACGARRASAGIVRVLSRGGSAILVSKSQREYLMLPESFPAGETARQLCEQAGDTGPWSGPKHGPVQRSGGRTGKR